MSYYIIKSLEEQRKGQKQSKPSAGEVLGLLALIVFTVGLGLVLHYSKAAN